MINDELTGISTGGRKVPVDQLYGVAPVTYERGQRCKYCPTILSSYNPFDVCGVCIDKEMRRLLSGRRRGLAQDEIRKEALKNLKSKKRKRIRILAKRVRNLKDRKDNNDE